MFNLLKFWAQFCIFPIFIIFIISSIVLFITIIILKIKEPKKAYIRYIWKIVILISVLMFLIASASINLSYSSFMGGIGGPSYRGIVLSALVLFISFVFMFILNYFIVFRNNIKKHRIILSLSSAVSMAIFDCSYGTICNLIFK